ncbi:ADP-ribosylation factor-like protein 16 isoform X2 [Phodopus roborovskii]|uniref:ADP-ribosylation factor-like protein 16 isoform X2 n=1 Tax=Phodopus roborovskii TaxID=109678 RepID=UPI0021E43440|nr:ADP-ribosylation factor-like protein 16 isoform X2 [Phodopus roborovskii]
MKAQRRRASRRRGSQLPVPRWPAPGMCLLLGAAGVGKTLLVKRLQKLSSGDGKGDLGDPPPTRPTVGTNLTDIVAHRKITIRELGGCMSPIWSSYYGNCHSLLRPALLHDLGGNKVIDQASRHHCLCQAEHYHGRNKCQGRHWLGSGAAVAPGATPTGRLTARWRITADPPGAWETKNGMTVSKGLCW